MERELKNSAEFLPGRLIYVALSAPPQVSSSKHFFSIDNELVYWNFFLDFGPLNFGQLYRFCAILNHKLADPKLKDKVIYYYSGSHPHRRANAAYLICSWAILFLNKTPEEAFSPFRGTTPAFPFWHDATPSVCTFNLTILDTLKGLTKARECDFFNLSRFKIEEYEHYEQVENGDLNWLMDGKFVAFAGPHASKEMSAGGYRTLTPEDYVPYFKSRNVTLVIRLNKKYYDSKRFTNHGIDHLDLYFLDGSNPTDQILQKFIQACEETPGAVAVHCKAGLGRTGSCIGAYVMKHYRWTAEEVIGWFRIARPGSIIGPQQQFMKEIQPKMWRDGDLMRAKSQSKADMSSVAALASKVGALDIGQGGISSSRPSSRAGAFAVAPADEKLFESAPSLDRPGSRGGIGAKEKDRETQGDSLRLRRQQQANAMSSSLAKSDGSTSIVGRTGLNTFMSSFR